MSPATEGSPHAGRRRRNPVLDRLFPDHEKRVARKLVRSWFIQGIGWYALVEVAARALLEGGFVLAMVLMGLPWVALLAAWPVFHTAAWFVLYGGFMRTWIVLGVSRDLATLEAHQRRIAERLWRTSLFALTFFRGSSGRQRMNARSDIDVCLVPLGTSRARILGLLFLWGLRVESLVRRIPVEARWLDLPRYAPYHVIGESPLIVTRDSADRRPPAERLARDGILIAISGLDGSGKTTVARRVVAGLRQRGLDATYIWGHRQALLKPEIGPDISAGVLFESLWKRLGRKMDDLRRHGIAKFLYDVLTSLDYVYVRWKIALLLRPGTVVVSDRYVADVIAYLKSWGRLRITIEGLLVGIAPEPDVGILFEIEPEVALLRKTENSPAQLRRFAEEYASLKTFLGLVPVDASRSVDEVYAQVARVLVERAGLDLPPPGELPTRGASTRSVAPAAAARG